MTEISDAARRLKVLRDQAGLTMRSVADSLGWSLTRYQHYEDRYKRKYLPFELARALDELFTRHGGTGGEVLSLAGVDRPHPAAARVQATHRPVNLNSAPAANDLPVLGDLKDAVDEFAFNSGTPKEFVERPASLKGVVNAFALYVVGELMEPRFFAGELLFLNPNRPLTRHCFVGVELADGRGLVRQFVRRNESEAVLRQLNPDKQVHVKLTEIKRLSRIVGVLEA